MTDDKGRTLDDEENRRVNTADTVHWYDCDPMPGELAGYCHNSKIVKPAAYLRLLCRRGPGGSIEGKLRQYLGDALADHFRSARHTLADVANTGAILESEALRLTEIMGGCDRLRDYLTDKGRPWVNGNTGCVQLDNMPADDRRAYDRAARARKLADRLWRLVPADRRRVAPSLAIETKRLREEHGVTRADGNKHRAVRRGDRVLSAAGTPGTFVGTTGPVVVITWDGNGDKALAFDARFPLATLWPFRNFDSKRKVA